ncbi:MAG: class I SAM-dependent methyltransferase [Cyclobacteriaceae bacterium]
MSTFKDHFSGHSTNYQKFRPDYPIELFEFLSSQCEEHKYAWDAGTGNGQCAVHLADFFEKILATDPSANQIAEAIQNENIAYDVSKAEDCPGGDDLFDLITVAQAFHWFDFQAFFAELERVIKPNGIFAVWTYTHAKVTTDIDEVYLKFYNDVVGMYWPPERRFVEEKYESIKFPMTEIEAPEFEIELEYSMTDYMSYLGTWSAVKNFKKEQGTNPLNVIEKELTTAWGNPDLVRKVVWPLHLRLFRN